MTTALSKELQRLTSNHQALLVATPEMIMLVKINGFIEYMNPSGAVFFDHLIAREGLDKIQNQLHNLIETLLSKGHDSKSNVGLIGDLLFECRLAPFSGYNGEDLHWLILRNPLPNDETSKINATSNTHDISIIGGSRAMQNLQSIVTRVAQTDTTVLITGESGTGKELVANLLKEKSKRKDKPFLTINCTTISDLLLESELFGYEKGSFTGAYKQRKGKFEIATGGTIFLDEIGDISPRMQASLLRVLQNGEITRVGGHTPIKVNVRILAATNSDLTAAIQDNTFRLDLYYRLNVINIITPPLREKKADLVELTTHFIQKYSTLFKKSINPDPTNILKKLHSYHWPGNVRELDNVIHRAVLMCKSSSLSNRDITFDMNPPEKKNTQESPSISYKYNGQRLKDIINQIEKTVIIDKLKFDRGNVAKTAESLDISKAALYDKLKRYNISIKSLR